MVYCYLNKMHVSTCDMQAPHKTYTDYRPLESSQLKHFFENTKQLPINNAAPQ